MNAPGERLHAVVITCSDSVAAGAAVDTSGPLAAELLERLGHEVGPVVVVPDDEDRIARAVDAAIDAGARIVVCTGGTGPGPRDVTPEALRAAGLRELPGLGEAIRAASRHAIPAADLSRALGGVLRGAMVLALPGSPGGVRDGMAAVGGLLRHAAAMAAGGGHGAPRSSPTPTLAPGPEGSEDLVGPAPIDMAQVSQRVAHPEAGATVAFAGVVRDHDAGRSVRALHYEGHPDASRVLGEVLAEARARPGVLGADARHRLGDLVVGDLAFAAAVSAAHRREAFEACSWLVDEAKARLPIWKHQQFSDGTDEWVSSP